MATPDAQLTEVAHAQMPFSEVLGLEAISAGPDRVEVRGEWAENRTTAGGAIHGGYLMALADCAGATCAFFNLPENSFTTTIESKTNFMRAATEGFVTAVATPVHTGRTTIVIQTDITRDDGKLVARVTQTQAVLPLG